MSVRPNPQAVPHCAQPVNTVLGSLGVLEDKKAFVSFNRETRVDP
jgi:hypothetical protein